jgi:hypothetical protein
MPINLNHTGAGVVTLNAPTSGTPTLTLPTADGTSGQALTTDGAGNLSFSTVGGDLYYRRNTATTLNSGVTTQQSWLGLTDGVTVAANTVYEFEGYFQLNTSGTTSHTERTSFILTTATVTDIDYFVERFVNSAAGSAQFGNVGTSEANLTVTGSITTTQNVHYHIYGTVAFGTGGSFDPALSFSAAPGGTSTIGPGAFFKLRAIGTTGSNNSSGTWV